MRRRYIFLTNDIGNVGGGNLYIAAKCKWLREQGWTPEVYYYERRPILLEEMRPFQPNYVYGLEFRFLLIPDSLRRATAQRILGSPSPADQIVIESFQYQMGYWGEYLASLCGGRHILYTLHESPPRLTPSAMQFMRFKLHRRELFGITPHAIPLLLPEADGEATFLYAAGSGHRAVASYPVAELSALSPSELTLLTVTRLEKPYVATMMQEVRRWAEAHPDIKTRFIIIGDTPFPKIRRRMLRILTRHTPANLDIIHLGYRYPVPQQAYDEADIFIGCAGAARCASESGVTTLVIDANDHQAIGVHPFETPTRLHRTTEPPQPLADAIERIRLNLPTWRLRAEGCKVADIPAPDFTSHLPLISPTEMPQEYYDLSRIAEPSRIARPYRLICRLGGVSTLYLAKRLKQWFQS